MLFCFTSSHRTAGFDLLDRLERSSAAVIDAIQRQQRIRGSVVLATCNRFEAYLDVQPGAEPADEFLELLGFATGIAPAELRAGSATVIGDDVASHLFAVSSGLESVVVGEGEIAGQVRRAYTNARKAGTVTNDLERLFQGASRTSRGVKNSTGLMTAGRSMVRLALDLAESRFADWSAVRVLLVGTGRYAGVSLAALRERGVTDASVWSRTGRAQSFALSHNIAAVPAHDLTAAVASADLVIACTVSPELVVTRRIVAEAMDAANAEHRLLIVDLGLPRNVEPSVAQLERVELLDLETISLHAPLEELQVTESAKQLVGAAAAEFAAKSAERQVEPALVALRQHIFAQLEAEIARNASRDASGDIERALRHLAGVLLHTPSVKARELARDGDADAFIDGVSAVFGVGLPATNRGTTAPAAADGRVAEAGAETA